MVAKIRARHKSWDSAKYGFLTHPEQRYERWLKRLTTEERNVFLVAEDQERLVGFLVATVEGEIPIYRLQEFAFIQDLWIEQEYRQKGIARQMVMLTIERCHHMGIQQIRLDTAAVNEAARQLFASCGFRISTIEMLQEL